MIRCECYKKREIIRKLHASGLKSQLTKCTFDKFETKTETQRQIKNAALKFLNNYKGKWFFIGGQNGCGKSHICTAIVGQLMLKYDKSVRYLLWRDDSVRLKAMINDPGYKPMILEYQTAEVLYIDDLFKGGITTADKNLAFQLLDYRYRNGMITIISSEYMTHEIYNKDPAIGGRIAELSVKIDITRDISKDYRLRRHSQ